jgi:hypothetical protein
MLLREVGNMYSRRNVCCCLILILCMSTLACASLFGNYGRIGSSDEVTQAFEEYQVNPQYRYYVSGPHINPNAIMGLGRDYQLDPSILWREVDMTPAVLKELVRGMMAQVLGNYAGLYGFKILDNNGRPIGVWYSILKARTFVQINSDGTVRIDTPPLDLYETEGDKSMEDRHMNRRH